MPVSILSENTLAAARQVLPGGVNLTDEGDNGAGGEKGKTPSPPRSVRCNCATDRF
jgi:hypothetical protein